MATHFSTLAWEIPWTEEPGRLYSPWGCKRVRSRNSESVEETPERKDHVTFRLSSVDPGHATGHFECWMNEKITP